MTDFDLAAQRAQVAALHDQADEVMSGLRAKLATIHEAQANALSITGEATSQDGSVRAVVDATGVVTSLEFAPSVFTRGTPERLAQATVATIQAAAAKARARVSETLAPMRAQGSTALAAAARGVPALDPGSLAVPAVPRTATDPTAESDPWRGESSESRPPHRAAADDDEPPGFVMDQGRW